MRGRSTVRRWMGALPSAAVVAALAVVATPSSGQAGTVNYTFEFTGGAQTWVVPAGVTQATFNVVGAQGGSAAGVFGVPNPGGFGGRRCRHAHRHTRPDHQHLRRRQGC